MADTAPAASRTAVMAAKQRAIHHVHGAEPKILDDPIAARLLGADFDPAETPTAGASHASVVLRSRWSESRLELAVERGVSQLVLLGAGFETFAYRQPAWAAGLRIYEIDHHASQEDKRRRLARAGVPLPANLEFVAIDFERTTLRDGLRASALDFSRPAFFSCLGVLGYLSREAAMAVFRLVAEFPPGSEIAYTHYAEAPPAFVADTIKSVGEPLLSWFDPGALATDLRGMGFGEVARLDREEADRRFFQNRADGLIAPEWPVMAAAVVGGR